MNTPKYHDLMKRYGPQLGQHPEEWRLFLEFLHEFFKNRGVERPLIVEIGTMHNVQKHFYEELLNAEHVGIDIAGNADIKGRSQAASTVAQLKARLAGRSIDVCFIDGDHTYAAVSADYELYGLLTRYIVALHDISHPYSPAIPEETMRLWNEIGHTEKEATLLQIKRHNAATTGITANRQMGIGLVVRGG